MDLLLYSGSSNAGTGYFDGAELHLRRAFWAATVHDGEPALPSGLNGWTVALDRAADLGMSYIRTDLRWASFQSTMGGAWDTTYFSYWHGIIQAAKVRGLDLIGVLNGPPPSGYNTNDPNRFAQFGAFCNKMATEFGADIYYYQILNEPNVHQEVTNNVAVSEVAPLTSSCYVNLVSGEGLIDFTHRAGFQTIVNPFVTAIPAPWDLWLSSLATSTGIALDILTIDFYPSAPLPYGNTQACNDWSPLDTLNNIAKSNGKAGGLMETGYDTTMIDFANGQPETYMAQDNYIGCALPAFYSKVNSWNANNPSFPDLLGGWYEIYDHQSSYYDQNGDLVSTGPLSNFGLVSSNLQEKAACSNFRNRVPGFGF